jgi:hypothetical protein
MDEELDRLTTSFAGMLEQRTRQLQQRVEAFSGALERFSDRISNTINTIVAALPGSSATPTPGTAGATSTGGIQLVRVVNQTDQPIPVRVVESVTRQEGSRGGGGFFGNLLGGIGSFVGNLVGGVASGFLSPFAGIAVGAELVAAIGLLIPVLNRAAEIVAEFRLLVEDVRFFANQLIAGIRGLIQGLFDNLTATGILPVSRLLASLLVFIDTGIQLILTYVQSVLTWVNAMLVALNTWLGNLINSLTAWFRGIVNSLPPFLRDLIIFLMETAVRPSLRNLLELDVRPWINRVVDDLLFKLVERLTTVFFGALTALGRVLIEVVTFAADWIRYAIVGAINELPGIDIDNPRPEGLGDRLSRGVRESFEASRFVARELTEQLFGRPAPPTTSGGTGGTGTGGSGTPPTEPRLRLPGFRTPELTLPEYAVPGSALESILTPRPVPPTSEVTAAATTAVPAGTATGGLTVNDGIHIQITAERVDRDNADETARLIADRVLAEIQRQLELGRFRRGLSTGTVQ